MELEFSLWKSKDGTRIPAARVIMLHGMGGTGALWRPIAAALEDEFDILAPNQRGHGQLGSKSRAPANSYTPLDYGRDVIDTMNAEDFHPAWIVGHSMGVRTACAVAHLKPEWVKGLVLIDLGFSGPAGGGLGDTLAVFLKKLPHHFESREQARAFMTAECPDPSIAQYLMAVSLREPDGAISFPFDHGALIETIEAARDVSVRGWIKACGERGLPVLVLRGASSLVWSHEQFEAEKAQLAAYPSIVFEEFEGAGHGLPFEKRLEFVARLKDLIVPTAARR